MYHIPPPYQIKKKKQQQKRKKAAGAVSRLSTACLSACAVTGPGASTLRMLWSQTSSRFSSSTDSPPLCERRRWKWTTHRGSTPTEEIKRTSRNKREATQTDCSLDLFFLFYAFKLNASHKICCPRARARFTFEIRPQEINSHSAHTINEKFI